MRVITITMLLILISSSVFALEVVEKNKGGITKTYSVDNINQIDPFHKKEGVEIYVDGELYFDGEDFEESFPVLVKAFALVVLDEVNILRAVAGLPERTTQQLKQAVKNKYNTVTN